MSRIGFAFVIVLTLADFAWAVPPWNFEGKSLTPQQIQALSMPADSVHSYDVRFYRLDLNLPMTNDSMTTHERITIASRVASLDTFSLDMDSLACDSVKRGGVPLVFSQPSGELAITLNSTMHSGDSTDLDIFFHRKSGTNGSGFHWYSAPPPTICYTYSEPSNSRFWFPCFDQPWDKAERGCQINVTVPDTFLACSNGLLDSVTANSSARTKTFWWTERFPISTYLMTFAASKYSTWKQRWARNPGDTIDIRYHIWTTDSSRSVTAFQNVPDMLSFFNRADVYGPYPFEKYGMVATYPFGTGGMENQTMTMIHRSVLNGGAEADELMSHELSHQWWGDMVTCFTWSNIWLNEGFATYSEALYMEHQQGQAFFKTYMDSFASYYFMDDSINGRFPIYNPPPNHWISSTTYFKGAWVQHMLRYMMSDTSATHGLFFQGLRAYGDSLKYKNASTADYQRILEHTYGDTLNWFFNEWVYLAGHPQYHVNWFGVPESTVWRVKVDISQNNGNGAPPVFHMPVEILFHLTGKDTLVHYPISTSPQHNEFVISTHPDSAVFDPGHWILKKVTVTNVGVETADRKAVLTPFALGGAFPSPFNRETRISYSIARKGKTELVVYDVSGRKVRTLMDGEGSPGASWVRWVGRDDLGRAVPSGVYFYRLQAGSFSDTKKMVVIR